MKFWVILFVLMFSAGFTQADWGPDPDLSTAWMEYNGPEAVSLFVTPGGSGWAFSEAMVGYGVTVDATVYLQLIGYSGNPIEGYPREDLWLEPWDGGLAPCNGGTCADTDTDVNGMTTWTTPLHAGGHSEANCLVMVNGSALVSNAGLNLHFNSPDISGDLVVNLTDVSLFAEDFYSSYHYRCDFYFDGVINLSDLGKLVQGMSSVCP